MHVPSLRKEPADLSNSAHILFSIILAESEIPAESEILTIFCYFLVVFPYIWPLAGPNIAKKSGKPILELFGFFGFWKISSRDQVGC